MEAAVQSNGQGPKGEAGSKPHPGLTLDPLQHLDGPEWLQTGLLESSQRLKPQEAQNYRRKALVVSWLSICITLALAVAAFTVSAMRSSASAFGFGFDALLDVLSSAIVAWRYSNAAAVHSAMREYMACVVLGVVFIISSLCIEGKAIHDLAVKMLPDVRSCASVGKEIGHPRLPFRTFRHFLDNRLPSAPPKSSDPRRSFPASELNGFLT
ncbi:transmembrane protein 163 isoform X2 [Lampetra planeri]